MKYIKTLITLSIILISIRGFSQTNNNTKMNLKDLHEEKIGVQTNMMFTATDGKIISLQILKNNQLKEHITNVPALLICVTGNAIYEDEKGNKLSLFSGDFIKIEPKVKHWINGIEDSNLLLVK